MSYATSASFADELCTKFKSDDLPKLTKLLKQVEAFKEDINLFQIRLILDANVVINSLRWLCKKRKNPTARTEIIELLDCQVVEGYAPTYLITEVEKNIPIVCAEQKIDEQAMRSRWEEIRSRITFIEVGGPGDLNDQSVIDPKDEPYLRLQKRLNATIISNDGHIERMGGKAIRINILAPLRAYSRKTAVEFNLKVVGIGSVILFIALASAFLSGIKATASKLGRIPKPLLLLGASLVIVAILHPTSRRAISRTLKSLLSGCKDAACLAFEQITSLIASHHAAKIEAQTELQTFTASLVGITNAK